MKELSYPTNVYGAKFVALQSLPLHPWFCSHGMFLTTSAAPLCPVLPMSPERVAFAPTVYLRQSAFPFAPGSEATYWLPTSRVSRIFVEQRKTKSWWYIRLVISNLRELSRWLSLRIARSLTACKRAEIAFHLLC